MAQGYFNATDDLGKRQAYAEALYQQSMADPGQGKMVGGQYVYTPLQALADAIKKGVSGYAVGAANRAIGDRDTSRNKMLADLIAPDQSSKGSQAPGPNGMSLAVPDLPDPNADKRAKIAALLQNGTLSPEAFAPQIAQNLGIGAPKAPIKVGKDDRLIDPNTYQPLVDAVAPPTNYNQPFLADGTPNQAYQDFQLKKSQAGRPTVSVTTNADRSFGSQLGENAGKILDASHSSAQGALQTIDAANQIMTALDSSGGVSAGPGASAVNFINQVTGGDPAKVANTRNAIQGLARLTVGARSALKGQGQVSDYEGKLLQKAASGDIDSMTAAEIRIVAKTAERLARMQIHQNAENVGKARSIAGQGGQGMVDFYDVPEPPPYAPQVKSGRFTIEKVE